jgi:cell division protease FtsH
MVDRMCVLLGGRASEELALGEVTTGACNDLEVATKMARSMVTQFGMSDKIGHVTLGKRQGPVFLGRDLIEHKDYSEDMAKQIDDEVKTIVEEAYSRAKSILQENIDNLHKVATQLLEKEVMDAQEVKDLIGFKNGNDTSSHQG